MHDEERTGEQLVGWPGQVRGASRFEGCGSVQVIDTSGISHDGSPSYSAPTTIMLRAKCDSGTPSEVKLLADRVFLSKGAFASVRAPNVNPWHSPSEERFLHGGVSLTLPAPTVGSLQTHPRRLRCTDLVETSR